MNDICITKLFQSWYMIFTKAESELTKLDSVAGDGDLGIVMKDGFQATYQYIKNIDETDLGKCFYQIGKVLNEAASSSMGTLLSMGFMTAGKKLRQVTVFDHSSIILLMQGLVEGIELMGKAKEGEKTFLDGLYPALRAALQTVDDEPNIFADAILKASQAGVEVATKQQAVHGRMAYRGDASKGMIDPGSMVAYYLVEGIAITIKQTGGS